MPQVPGALVPDAPIEHVPANAATTTAERGDFFLTHGDHLISAAIRVGQGWRFRGSLKLYAYWNHAGIFVDDQGGIIEAEPHGVVERDISHYTPRQYAVVGVGKVADPGDRARMVKVACAMRGEPFGWVTMVSNLVHMATGSKFGFFVDGRTVCSGLVARCLSESRDIYFTHPDDVSPADLAKLFDVRPPSLADHQPPGAAITERG